MAEAPAEAKAAAACKSRVDLPMPGSPPTRIAEAGTMPPPRTRSSSPMPESARGSGGSSVASAPRAIRLPRAAPSERPAGPSARPASSTMEFQAPQASQRPAHFEWVAPQALQTNVAFRLAIGAKGARFARETVGKWMKLRGFINNNFA